MNRLFLVSALMIAQAAAIRVIGIEYMLFGGDYDEHGCKPSAGYTWCNETQDCIPMNQLCVEDFQDTFLNLTLPLAPVLEM